MSKTLDELNEFNERCREKYMKKVEGYENNKKDYVPKQKVKDKIEEVKLSGGGNGKDNVENLARELVIEVLQELLEEGE